LDSTCPYQKLVEEIIMQWTKGFKNSIQLMNANNFKILMSVSKTKSTITN